MNATETVVLPDRQPDPADLMLHRAPMLLLDRIVSHAPGRLVAAVDITADKTFYEEPLAGVPSWVGIEYMAQAIAALAGLGSQDVGMSIDLGLLVSCRRYQVATPVFSSGLTLHIQVEELVGGATGMAAYRCSIGVADAQGAELATGQLGVYQRG